MIKYLIALEIVMVLQCAFRLPAQNSPDKISQPRQIGNVQEVKNIIAYDDFWNLYEEIIPLKSSEPLKAVAILEPAFEKASDNFEMSALALELGELYTTTKQPDKCFAVWEKCFDQKISVFGKLGNNFYPDYVNKYTESPRFKEMLDKNNNLIKEASNNLKAEYFVQKPVNYSASKQYPLIIILHGGVGNIQDLIYNWKSELFKSDYVVAYLQGRDLLFSYTRMFGNNGIKDIREIYRNIINDYSIDTTRIVLAGMSAGGSLSLDLAMDRHIQAKGLLLAFPGKGRVWDERKINSSPFKEIRISMICGEYDYAIKQQKEMAVIFDKAGISNRFIIFPETGHEFPKDFSRQIDISLKFIENK